ncbi:Cof-type HAD-IIB family hydrolase [Cohnella sp.]|uniref:Cof-type HAD-IIB family hydrolase n=1 Tax=Cohnella sp. TaxID=1883426 RepID=UPI0035654F16
MKYNVMFSDIDGTLLNSVHEISARTRLSIRKLTSMGVPFIMVSARMPQGIIPLQNELGINAPIVCFSGALIMDAEKCGGAREVIAESPMDIEVVSSVYRLIEDTFPNISVSLYNKDMWLVNSPEDEWIIQEHQIIGIAPTPFDLRSIAGSTLPVFKMLCMGDPGCIAALREVLLERFPNLTIYESKPTYLEIMSPGVSKSKAMDALLGRFRADRRSTLAIGDNYNDLDMIQSAGLGVAMGNAPDGVKANADYITDTNDRDGVTLVIEKYFYNS